GKNQAFFSIGNITFISRVISGQYPEYNQVLPPKSLFKSKVFINKQRLLESLERAALLSKETGRNKGNIVKLQWNDDILTLSSDVPDMGRIKEEMSILLEGENIEASYNIKYLTEALKVIEGERVVMHLTGPATPGIIMPDEEENSYLYLVLPIRINNQ
ncbi:MAG: DNA polymerase III subunit beta, partial [Clostridiales bacterium]